MRRGMDGIMDLVGLGVVWAVRQFRAYLLSNKCKVFIDHAPLKALLNTRHPSGKMAMWSEEIAELDLEICYKPVEKMPTQTFFRVPRSL